jgi:hypothetical protein
VPGLKRDTRVQIASQPAEWDAALKLVADNYRACGYEAPSNKPLRFTKYHALPETIVLVAKQEDEVVATYSMVFDNPLLGLPMESIYADEIALLRRQGRRLAEVTSLAVSGLSQREFVQVFTTMIRLGVQYHNRRGGDTWVITINPHHRTFYCKAMGFQPLGECRSYPLVADAPAEAFFLDRQLMKTHAPKMHELAYGEWLPPQALTATPLTTEQAMAFAEQSSQTDQATVAQIRNTKTRKNENAEKIQNLSGF